MVWADGSSEGSAPPLPENISEDDDDDDDEPPPLVDSSSEDGNYRPPPRRSDVSDFDAPIFPNAPILMPHFWGPGAQGF